MTKITVEGISHPVNINRVEKRVLRELADRGRASDNYLAKYSDYSSSYINDGTRHLKELGMMEPVANLLYVISDIGLEAIEKVEASEGIEQEYICDSNPVTELEKLPEDELGQVISLTTEDLGMLREFVEGGPATTSYLSEAVGLSHPQTNVRLHRMQDDDLVVRDVAPRMHYITPRGWAALEKNEAEMERARQNSEKVAAGQ